MFISTSLIYIVFFISYRIRKVTTKGNLIALNSLQVLLLTVIFNFGDKFILLTNSLISIKYELVAVSILTALVIGFLNLPIYKKFKLR